jgi:lincosamide nucleotidyltransferase
LDDFGHHTALFENGVRGEFHFMRASQQAAITGWKGYGWFPRLEDAVLLDRSGDLSRYAQALVGGPPVREGAELVESLSLNLINLMLFGANLLKRGEFARAWALLGKAHENLLKLIRLHENATDHWPTPSRALESDLPNGAYTRYLSCTAGVQPAELSAAYRESWRWGRELFDALGGPLGIELPAVVIERVDELLE